MPERRDVEHRVTYREYNAAMQHVLDPAPAGEIPLPMDVFLESTVETVTFDDQARQGMIGPATRWSGWSAAGCDIGVIDDPAGPLPDAGEPAPIRTAATAVELAAFPHPREPATAPQ